jgi:predicted RNA polymerase sigma factor
VGSPEAALEVVEALALEDYQYLHSTRAELLRRVGRSDEARAAYQKALELTSAEAEAPVSEAANRRALKPQDGIAPAVVPIARSHPS